MKPSIAYLVSRYPAVSHTFILREVRGLRALGFDIQVASINPPDRSDAALTAEEREEKQVTYYVKQHGVRGALLAHALFVLGSPLTYLRGLGFALALGGGDWRKSLYGLFYFTEALMVWRWMQQNRQRHLHVHFATAAATVGMILRHSFPATLSITVHGPDEFYDVSAHHLAEKFEHADFAVCIGDYARSQVMKLSPATQWHKFEVCPLGVDPEVFRPHSGHSHAGSEILCVGRLVAAKGQHILLDACHMLEAQGKSFTLRLVGDGPDRAALEAHCARLGLTGRVVFDGALNQDEVMRRYAEAAIFALPSFAEGVPVVLMEAMALEIPCVTTRITGIPELIRDGVNGLLVAPSDVDGLAGALSHLLDHPDQARRLGQAGRCQVLRNYHLPHNLARLAALFQQRLAGSAS